MSTTIFRLDLNGADPSMYIEEGLGPHYYWPNTSSPGAVTFYRAQPNPFWEAQVELPSGIRSILIAPDANASDLNGVQLDWRLGWHQTQSNGELSYTAPRLAFGASATPQNYTFFSGNTNYSVTASSVARQDGGKTLYDLKLESSAVLPSSAMQDLLRQIGIEYRQGIVQPTHDRNIDLTVKLSSDGINFVGAPAGQAGTVELDLSNTAPFPLHAIYSGSTVALSFGRGDFTFSDTMVMLSDERDAHFGHPTPSLFGLEVRPLGASSSVDTSFEVVEVKLERQALLILNKPIPAGADVRVRYTDPANNQITNVVQDWRGNDASSSDWIPALPITGFMNTGLPGAQLGISSDEEFPYGLYVADADGAGIGLDSVVRVTAVNTQAGTYGVEIRPAVLFPNPAYDANAPAGSFRNYRYSNEMVRAELKPKAGQSLPAVGTTYSLLDLFSLTTEPMVKSITISVLAGQTESAGNGIVFDLYSISTLTGSEIPLSLAVTGLASVIGNDTITGRAFNDTLEGWWGNDSISGGDGNDLLDGGAGVDLLSGDAGNDSLRGGDGNDGLVGGKGNDLFEGGTGQDQALYAFSQSTLSVDFTITAPFNQKDGTWYGPQGDGEGSIDQLSSIEVIFVAGGEANDVLLGAAGLEMLIGGAGNDTLDGGIDGRGVVNYGDAPGAVSVDLAGGTSNGAAGNDTLRNFHAVIGSTFSDVIKGDDKDNFLRGMQGNDTLTGGGGNDSSKWDTRVLTAEAFKNLSPFPLTDEQRARIDQIAGVAETDRLTDFSLGDRIEFQDPVSLVTSSSGMLLAGQMRIDTLASRPAIPSGALIAIGRDMVPGADLTIELPGVDASSLRLTADGSQLELDAGTSPPVQRTGRTKYFVLGGNNFTDFDLDYPEVTLQSSTIEFIGSDDVGSVDAVFVRPGVILDFTQSGAGVDKAYLSGNFADYSRTLAGNTIRLERGEGPTLERLTVAVPANTAEPSDKIVFADGVINGHDLMLSLPTPNTAETSLNPLAAQATPSALIKAFSLNRGGGTISPVKPGVPLIAHGGIGVDQVYVADFTTVDATLLGASADEVYLRGNWSDYYKTIAGTTITFQRHTVDGLYESVTVAAGARALNDLLIFADGAVYSSAAKNALAGNPGVLITQIPGYNPGRTTPGVGPELRTQVLDGVMNLDPSSDLVFEFNMPVSAVAGKFIRIINDGGSGANGEGFHGENTIRTLAIDAGDATQVSVSGTKVVINPAVDLDLANRYHIEMDAGAFKASGNAVSEALQGPTWLNFSTVTPGGQFTPAPSKKVGANGAIATSFDWIDLEGIGSYESRPYYDLKSVSVALVFKDYSSLPADPQEGVGYDGVEAPTFFVGALSFGSDDQLYIDNQSAEPNDLEQTIIMSNGYSSIIQFAPSDGSLGGYLDVSLAGYTGSFESLTEWMQRLGSSTPPVISG